MKDYLDKIQQNIKKNTRITEYLLRWKNQSNQFPVSSQMDAV